MDSSALFWVSNVFLGIGGLAFVAGGLPLWWDGMTNTAQLGAIDPVLKGVDSKDKAYAVLRDPAVDPVVKHLCFWLVVMMRNWGAFQVACSAALWCVIFLVPIEARAAAHFILGSLDAACGGVEASTGLGLPVGVDVVAGFGGRKGRTVGAEEAGAAGFARPQGLAGGMGFHLFLAAANLALGVCCAVLAAE